MSNSSKMFRVRVTDLKTGKSKTNIKIPTSLADWGMKMAAKFAPEEVKDLDFDQLLAAVRSGETGKMVDVEDEEKGERVEVFVE